MENKPMILAVVHTVFMYRVNVALAALLIFINLQILLNISFIVDPAYLMPNAPYVAAALLVLALAYGVHAFNGMITKITVFEDALEYKTLFVRKTITASDIDHVAFARKDPKCMRITITLKEGKPFIISTAKYKDPQPVVAFCAKLKQS